MRNDNDLGGFENLAKGCNKLTFCCAIQKLSPVGGPPCGSPGLPTSHPAHPRQQRGFGQDDIHPAPRTCLRAPEPSRSEPKLSQLAKAATPRLFTRLCRPLRLSRDRRLQSWTGALPTGH